MPVDEKKSAYDFEKLYFEKDKDVDIIINSFFEHFDEIKGEKEYIKYKIKKTIEHDRRCLMEINGKGEDILNRKGKISYVKHDVIPEENNGKEYYIYCVNTFI